MCPGTKAIGCKDKNPVPFGKRLCTSCGEKEREYDAIHHANKDGTPEDYERRRNGYARKMNRPLDSDTLVPIASRISSQPAHFKSLLECFSPIFNLNQSRILFLDTEYDKRGGSELHLIREWYFRDLDGNVLHIRRYLDDNPIKYQRIRNPLYSDRQAAMDIFQLIQNFDFLIAFEPPNCDRYKLKSLLDSVNVSWYPLIEKKCLDLQRLCINHFCHSDPQENEVKTY
jgi:hypothetical protein